MQKSSIILASVLIQAFLGGVYAWSTLAKPLREVYGLSSFQTELVYGLSIGLFAVTMLWSGRLILRVGPRPLALSSGLLYFLAFAVAALGRGSFAAVLLGLGVVMGVAIGLGYVTPLTTAVRWFPRHKGLVTGLAVFGFGGGSLLSAYLVQRLLQTGWDILEVFWVLGAFGGVVILLSGWVMRFPDSSASSTSVPPVPDRTVFQSAGFWLLALGMFFGTLGGLVVIGKAANMAAVLLDPALGAAAVGVLALGNSLGRLFWGWMNDLWGRWTLPVCLAMMSAVLGALMVWADVQAIFFSALFLVGLGFGGNLVLYAVKAEEIFGTGSIARIYPFIFLGYGIAAVVGPPFGGWLYDQYDSYGVVFGLAAVSALVGLVLVSLFALDRSAGTG